jgi:PAS domain S-box-containing protein
MSQSRSSRFRQLLGSIAGLLRRGTTDLSELAQATTSAVIVTDEAGNIAHVSPGFTALTGFEAADVVGQTPAMALHGQHTDYRTVEVLRTRCKAGEPFGVNILLYARDHRPIWVTSQGRPIVRGGKFRGYLITQTAISQKASQARGANPVRATAA